MYTKISATRYAQNIRYNIKIEYPIIDIHMISYIHTNKEFHRPNLHNIPKQYYLQNIHIQKCQIPDIHQISYTRYKQIFDTRYQTNITHQTIVNTGRITNIICHIYAPNIRYQI